LRRLNPYLPFRADDDGAVTGLPDYAGDVPGREALSDKFVHKTNRQATHNIAPASVRDEILRLR
jgi:hypothetical protein